MEAALGRATLEARTHAGLAETADIDEAAIYCSPLARTMQTAAAIVDGRRLTVRPQEELRDIDYGLWAGRAPEEIDRTGPGSDRRWRARPESVAIPEGESLLAVRRRVGRVVRTRASRERYGASRGRLRGAW